MNVNPVLLSWYRAMRKYHAARHAFRIAKNVWLSTNKTVEEVVALGIPQADIDYVLRSARP